MQKEALREKTEHGTSEFPFGCYAYDGDNPFPVKLHWHEEFEIMYLEQGTFQFTLNLQEYEMKGPAFVFVHAEEIHSLMLLPKQKESAIVFDMHMLESSTFDAIEYRMIHPIIKGEVRFPSFMKEGDEGFTQIQALFCEIRELSSKQSIASYLRIKARLYDMMAVVLDENLLLQTGKKTITDDGRVETMKKVLTFITDHYHRELSVDEIAAVAGLNSQYFCRYFKRMTGKTITQYINDLRIKESEALLLTTDKKVIEIAENCGYENVGYFIKRFRKEHGMTPSEFRANKK